MDDPRSDNELMLSVRGGDLHALGLLFRRHRNKVHSLAWRLTGNSATADDLVQETFLRILRYSHGFQGTARFTTWMYRIVRNAAMSQMERESRRSATEVAAWREGRLEQDHHFRTETELTERLGAEIARLPVDQREVLILSRYHDLRYAEIAEVCECTVAAVKARVYRAMRTLRHQMGTRERAHEQLRTNER